MGTPYKPPIINPNPPCCTPPKPQPHHCAPCDHSHSTVGTHCTTVRATTEVVYKKGYSPFVSDETGTWFEYDDKLKGFVDTGIIAEGGGTRIMPIPEPVIETLWGNCIDREVI